MDTVCAHLFDKLESSSHHNHDKSLDNGEPKLQFEGDTSGHGPIPLYPFTPFQHSSWMPRTHQRDRMPHQPMDAFTTPPRNVDTAFDEGAWRVTKSLTSYAFQDWVIALEDYFN